MSAGELSEALRADHAARARARSDPPFLALQRVIVRMLFDPAFAMRVHDAPAEALAGLDLPAPLVAQLRANDRRLWSADRLRRSRALKVLMEEFRISTALVLLETRRLARLDAFFSTRHFHEAVQTRGYMALAFADYLEDEVGRGELRRPELPAVLAIEAGMARARRTWREAHRGRRVASRQTIRPGLVVVPGVGTALVPGGTLDVIQHLERYLFETGLIPALALCDDAPRPEPLPALRPEAPEAYVFEPDAAGQVKLSGIPRSYSRLIEACSSPRIREDLARELSGGDLSIDDVLEMAQSLVSAGILREEGMA